MAEIELEQVSNVHIIFNLDTEKGRYRNVFQSEEQNSGERLALTRFLCNQLDLSDLETTFSTINFHFDIVDVLKWNRQALQRFFTKVIQS